MNSRLYYLPKGVMSGHYPQAVVQTVYSYGPEQEDNKSPLLGDGEHPPPPPRPMSCYRRSPRQNNWSKEKHSTYAEKLFTETDVFYRAIDDLDPTPVIIPPSTYRIEVIGTGGGGGGSDMSAEHIVGAGGGGGATVRVILPHDQFSDFAEFEVINGPGGLAGQPETVRGSNGGPTVVRLISETDQRTVLVADGGQGATSLPGPGGRIDRSSGPQGQAGNTLANTNTLISGGQVGSATFHGARVTVYDSNRSLDSEKDDRVCQWLGGFGGAADYGQQGQPVIPRSDDPADQDEPEDGFRGAGGAGSSIIRLPDEQPIHFRATNGGNGFTQFLFYTWQPVIRPPPRAMLTTVTFLSYFSQWPTDYAAILNNNGFVYFSSQADGLDRPFTAEQFLLANSPCMTFPRDYSVTDFEIINPTASPILVKYALVEGPLVGPFEQLTPRTVIPGGSCFIFIIDAENKRETTIFTRRDGLRITARTVI